MPRKLNKLPTETLPSEGGRGIKENPATEPAPALRELAEVHKNASKAERKRADGAESALRSHMEDEDLATTETLRATRATLKSQGERLATLEKLDTMDSENPKAIEKAKKDQDKIINKAAALGLSQSQFLQMLDNGPLEENESKSFFGNITNTFRRLAGQPWAGKDAKQLNALMESYRGAEKIVDSANATALENAPSNARPRYRAADASQMSKGGDSLDEMKKSAADMVNPESYKMTGKVNAELAKLKAEESNPGSTANALLEKYSVTISKGRSLAKGGKLVYENQGTEELSVADLVKSQTLLSEAYNQILAKNKKDAQALVDAIAEIRNENNGSALATEDISAGRGVAEGRKQSGFGINGMQVASRGAGASSLDRGLSERLQNFDTKKAKNEFAEEATVEAEWKSAASKAKKNIATAEAEEMEQAARTEKAKPKVETIRKEYSEREKQIELESAWLKSFGQRDAQKAFALMKPSASEMELKVVNGPMIANSYRAMLTEEAVLEAKLKRKAPGVTNDQLKALRASLDAVRAYAATVDIHEDDMALVAAAGRKNMERMAAEDNAEFLADEDVELIEKPSRRSRSEKSSPSVKNAA